VWQREWLRGAVLAEQLSYWRAQLNEAPTLELPTDRPRPAHQSFRGAVRMLELSEELTRGLRELSRREGVTLFMTLLSSWQALLARYSGQWDLSVGTPIANRTRGETEGLIGFFVNTLVLRARMNLKRVFVNIYYGCGKCVWERMRIRTCRSRCWWKSCSRNATRAAHRYSR